MKFAPATRSPLASDSLNVPQSTDRSEPNPSDSHPLFSLSEALKKCRFFQAAPESFYTAIFTHLKVVTHHPQQYLIRYGEPSRSLYVLLKGTVAVTSNDGETVLAELNPGSYFGEIGVLFDRPRTATVIAKTKSLSAVISKEALATLLPKYPHVERVIRDEAQKRLSEQIGDMRSRRKARHSSDKSQCNVPKKEIILPNLNYDASVSIRESSPVTISSQSDSSSNHLQDIFIPVKKISASLGLSSIPFHVLYTFATDCTYIVTKQSNEYVFKKSDNSTEVYFILEGSVKIVDTLQIQFDRSELQGAHCEKVVATLGQYDYFGEMAFLNKCEKEEHNQRTANVVAACQSKLLVFPHMHLKRLCEQYPIIYDAFKKIAAQRITANSAGFHRNNTGLLDMPAPITTGLGLRCYSDSAANSATASSNTADSGASPHTSIAHNNAPSTSSASSTISATFPTSASAASTSSTPSSTPATSPIVWNSNFFSGSPGSINFSAKRRSSVAITQEVPPVLPAKKRRLSATEFPLHSPPVNPPSPAINSFPGQSLPHPTFQYVNHAKRLKYSHVNTRRRSSLLRYTPMLPDHILLSIFKLLDIKTLMKLRRVCQRWRQILYFAPDLFTMLDLSVYHTAITDEIAIYIADFVGSRVEVLDVSNCYHITDKGFSYLVSELGGNGKLKVVKMKSVWHVNNMSIMDLAAPSIGANIQELDFSNCKKIRDDVIKRLVGESGSSYDQFGCVHLKKLNLSYCKALTDTSMYYIANNLSEQLEYLNIKRCTNISNNGFQFWIYKKFYRLKTLILSDCTYLTHSAISAICFSAPMLENLDLSFCCALDESSLDILRVGCPYLRTLDLSFCGNAVCDNSLLSLSLSLMMLQTLNIKGCIRVSRAGVDILLSGCCPLKYLNISQCRNAHTYPGGVKAAPLPVKEGDRSVVMRMSPEKGAVEIVV